MKIFLYFVSALAFTALAGVAGWYHNFGAILFCCVLSLICIGSLLSIAWDANGGKLASHDLSDPIRRLIVDHRYFCHFRVDVPGSNWTPSMVVALLTDMSVDDPMRALYVYWFSGPDSAPPARGTFDFTGARVNPFRSTGLSEEE